jgi:Kef-type K+ transport system membrane component KefB
MEIILAILALLSFALILGSIAERFGIPTVVGNIISGIILGPAVFGLLNYSSGLSGISEIALFFIMLLVGIEATTQLLTKHIRSAVVLSASSFILPASIMMLIAAFVFHLNTAQAIITSIAIGVPSISIISVLVMRYDLLGTEDGARIVSSVVLTDVIAFMVLAAIGVSSVPIYIVIISVLAFILVLLAIDRMIRYHAAFIRKRLISKYRTRGGEELIFAGIILMGLIGSAVLQIAGITYVLGAFFVGLLIHDAIVGKRIYGILKRTFSRITNSFFIPIFFSIAGLQVVRPSDYLWLMVVLIIVSGSIGGILSYLAGSKLLKKLRPVTAVALLGSRGAVGIIIANIALLQGDINTDLYSIIILGTVILSLVLPALMGGEDSAMRRRSR